MTIFTQTHDQMMINALNIEATKLMAKKLNFFKRSVRKLTHSKKA